MAGKAKQGATGYPPQWFMLQNERHTHTHKTYHHHHQNPDSYRINRSPIKTRLDSVLAPACNPRSGAEARGVSERLLRTMFLLHHHLPLGPISWRCHYAPLPHWGDQPYNTGTRGRHTIQAREKYLGEYGEFGSGWKGMAPGPSHHPQAGYSELAISDSALRQRGIQ